MNLRVLSSFALLGLITFASGCQNKLHDENLALYRQNRELQTRNNELDMQLQQAPNPAEVQRLQSELASRDQQIAALQNQLRTPPPGQASDPSLAGIEVTRDDRAGTVTVNIPGDVLFASGQAELKESSKRTLDRIVKAIQADYAGKKIMVDGHTDSDPISRTRNKWKDNLDLSAERARVVADYLSQHGVNGNLVGERAFAATSPKANKSASRRVEIVVKTRETGVAAGE
jgi:flagellar motor protein MotB